MTAEDNLNELLDLARVPRTNSKARAWLSEALRAIPHALRAKKAARPLAERNVRLEAVARATIALQDAYRATDPATRANLYSEGIREGSLLSLLDKLRIATRASQKDARGWRRQTANDEAVKLLVGFVVRFGGIKPAKKADSFFGQFARRAFEVTTGEDSDLTRSIRRVLASGWAETERERASVYTSRSASA